MTGNSALRGNWLFFVCLLCWILAGCGGAKKAVNFTLTFKDAKSLRPGHFLVYKGIRIGEVKNVALDPGGVVKVDVTVDPTYKANVYREAEFIIEKPGGIVDVSGERQLTMKDRSGPHTPLQNGDIVVGTESFWGEFFGQANEIAKGLISNFGDAITGFESSPEGDEFLKGVQDFAEEAKDVGKDQYESFKDKALSELKQKALELKAQMEKEGKMDEARKFWDEFQGWMDSQK